MIQKKLRLDFWADFFFFALNLILVNNCIFIRISGSRRLLRIFTCSCTRDTVNINSNEKKGRILIVSSATKSEEITNAIFTMCSTREANPCEQIAFVEDKS